MTTPACFPQTISPEDVTTLQAQHPNLCVVDVRTPQEHALLGIIPGALCLPLQTLDQTWPTALNPKIPTVVVCEHGVRSTHACQYLSQQGFTQLYNLGCGMAGWQAERAFPAV
jgi:rhodanese-related sulfurtransferase